MLVPLKRTAGGENVQLEQEEGRIVFLMEVLT